MRRMSSSHVPHEERDAPPSGRSAVGFAAVLDGEDEDGIAVVVKADAVVTDAQAQSGGSMS